MAQSLFNTWLLITIKAKFQRFTANKGVAGMKLTNKHNKHWPPTKIRLLLVSLALILSSCASAPLQMTGALKQRLQGNGTAIIADGCHYHRVVSKRSRFVVSESMAHAKVSAASVKALLSSKGITINSAKQPFVCGSLFNSKLRSNWAAKARESEAKKPNQWPLIIPAKSRSAAEIEAYKALMGIALPAITTESKAEYTPILLAAFTAPFMVMINFIVYLAVEIYLLWSCFFQKI